jgi:hypothetical protein
MNNYYMNNHYMSNYYLLEKLAASKQQEALREAEQARLLREAGLSDANLLSRAAEALRNLLAARRERLQGHRSAEHQAYSS